MNDATHICRVCGLYLGFASWGEDGGDPTHEICPCCGVEFGLEDSAVELARNYRQKWLDNGAQWFSKRYKPENWSLEEQLGHIPLAYQ